MDAITCKIICIQADIYRHTKAEGDCKYISCWHIDKYVESASLELNNWLNLSILWTIL